MAVRTWGHRHRSLIGRVNSAMKTSHCPSCRREFPSESIGHFGVVCPYCGYQIPQPACDTNAVATRRAVAETARLLTCQKCSAGISGIEAVTWGGNSYCRNCVNAAGLGDFDPAATKLEEVLSFSLRYALARSMWSWIVVTTGIVLLVVGVLVALVAAFAVGGIAAGGAAGGKAIDPLQVLRGIGLVAGGAWLFVSVVSLPMSLIACLFVRRRCVRVANGTLIHETRWSQVVLRLANCSWHVSRMGADKFSLYFSRPPLIVVRAGQTQFVCGFSPDARKLWEGFFTLAAVHKRTGLGAGRWVLFLIMGYCIGDWAGNGRWFCHRPHDPEYVLGRHLVLSGRD